jgi:hypothetical protein
VRSLDQRQKTIVKVTQCIVEKQRDFFEKGIEHLRPMILRDVAEAVGMHESTISRVTTNKYVHTPRGIFELKYFFNSSIRRIAEEDIASESVKQAIKKIIGEEDPRESPSPTSRSSSSWRSRRFSSPGAPWRNTGRCWEFCRAPSASSISSPQRICGESRRRATRGFPGSFRGVRS